MELERPLANPAGALAPSASSASRRLLARANAAIVTTEEALAVALFYALLAGFGVQVFARFVIRYPIPWSEEFCSLVFVWLGAFGTSIGVRWGSHFVAFDLPAKLRGRPQRIAAALVRLAVGAIALVLLVDGAQFTREGMTQLTPILNVPAAIGDAAVPVSAALMLWHLAYAWAFGGSAGGFEDLLGLEGGDA